MNPEINSTRRVAQRATLVILGYGLYALVCARTPGDLPGISPIPGDLKQSQLHAWRANGCQSCHSLFGLGGHTGPDLTNVISRRSPEYVRTMMLAGPPGMPSFQHLEDTTIDEIVGYLSRVDQAAEYPPHSFSAPVFGGHE